jgi:formylglycine-generating enzyme required for sulfatase activity
MPVEKLAEGIKSCYFVSIVFVGTKEGWGLWLCPHVVEGSTEEVLPMRSVDHHRLSMHSVGHHFLSMFVMPALLCVALFIAYLTLDPNLGDEGEAATVTTETVLLPGDVSLEMVWIEPGSFMMGLYAGKVEAQSNESPQHSVTLTQGFWMGKHELTQAQWIAVMGSNPSYFLDGNHPVEMVSWNDVQTFITALNTATGKTFRLPTEAEWEYACREGDQTPPTRFYWGNDGGYSAIGDHAWYAGNSETGTHDVGGKSPNACGLYDMSGNVWEWCADWYGTYPSGSMTDPKGAASGSERVLRGGSWDFSGSECRSARRFNASPSRTFYSFGFRLAR